MAKKLTALAVTRAKPKTINDKLTRNELPDAGCTGLYLVVQPSGVKSWVTRYRYHGRPIKLTLGSTTALSLADARAKATAALAEVHRGVDPAAQKREAKKAAKQ